VEVDVCEESGQRISSHCPNREKMWIAKAGLRTGACTFHREVHLTADRKYRVHASCAPIDDMITESWFVLPPTQEHFYKTHNISYQSLPPYRADCADPSSVASMDLIYPRVESKIFIPRELDGSLGSTVFQAVHRDPSAVVYWHLDGLYLGATTRSHKLPLAPSEGKHELTLVDEQGEILERSFQIVSK
jgi:penicillin-binding protein 1C